MFINVDILRTKKACHNQVSLFKKLFPDGIEVTTDLCVEYYDKFDWDWAVDNLLTETGQDEYVKIKVAAYNEYRKIHDAARNEYKKIRDVALGEYWKTKDAAMVEYEKIRDAAWNDLRKICAKTFGELAMKQV